MIWSVYGICSLGLCLCLLGACRSDIFLCPCHGRDLCRVCHALDSDLSYCSACLVLVPVLVISIFYACGHRRVWSLCCSRCARHRVFWSPAGVGTWEMPCSLDLGCRDGVALLVVRPWLYSRVFSLSQAGGQVGRCQVEKVAQIWTRTVEMTKDDRTRTAPEFQPHMQSIILSTNGATGHLSQPRKVGLQ